MINIEKFYEILIPIIKNKDSSSIFCLTRAIYNTYLQKNKGSKNNRCQKINPLLKIKMI